MNVVFLSPNFPPNFWNFVRGLKEAGATPLCIDAVPWEALSPGLRANLAEYYRVEDLHDHDALVRALGWFTHRHGRLQRLDSMNEYWLQTEAQLRDDFNIPGLRSADMARVKKKSEMKRCYEKAGVPVAPGRVCHTAAELHDFVSKIGFPIVAKPDIGVGAAATFKLHNQAEMDAFLAANPSRDYIVEQFIAGDMFSYDGLADREGRVIFDASIQYGGGVMETVNGDSEMWYSLQRVIPQELVDLGRRVVRAFDVRERFFHFEFFRRPGGEWVALEVNMRPPGGMTVDMWNYQNNIDIYRAWGDLLVTGAAQVSSARPYHVTWIGRKDRFRYAASAEEVRRRFGDVLVHHERVSDIFAKAIGNEGFILRSSDPEPIRAAAAFIYQKA